MSLECGECERDLRGGHDESCSRYLSGSIWRHIKTGGLYTIVNVNAKMQAETWFVDSAAANTADMERVVVYRSEKDRSVWVRPYDEFMDGRFERVEDEG